MDELVLKMARLSASRVHHLIEVPMLDQVPTQQPSLCGKTPGAQEKWWPAGNSGLCPQCAEKAQLMLID